MAAKENCAPRLTRAAAKRSVSAPAADPRGPAKKKRVALGEITSASNAVTHLAADLSIPPPAKPKSKPARKEHSLKAAPIEIAASVDAGSEVHDPQLCVHYASDIYQYLRSMEV